MHIEVTSDVFRLAQVFTISRGSRTEAKVLTVRITDGGVTGVGECVPYARYGETLESVTAQIAGLSGVLTREGLYDLLPAGAARNAVDCALWDLEAKRSGTPVWQLAGLAPLKPEMTAYTLSLDMPENMRAQAAKNAFRPLLKIKLGTPDDMPRLEAVRAGAPDSTIIVDANEGWSAAVYADLAPHLVRLGVALVEQPGGVPDVQAGRVQVDVVVGQHEAHALVVDQGLAEGHAAVGVIDRDFLRADAPAEPAHAVRQACGAGTTPVGRGALAAARAAAAATVLAAHVYPSLQ